jgi:hypothetical protein
LAVYRPECQVALVESVQKKAVFLAEAARGFSNVKVLAVRGETLAPEFDWIVSRAVAWSDLPRLAPRFAVLAGDSVSGVPVVRRIQLPWGKQRCLLIGEYQQSRSS